MRKVKMTLRLTKASFRQQKLKFNQLSNYLPTLQLKKSMLQVEVNHTNLEIENLKKMKKDAKKSVENFSELLIEPYELSLLPFLEVKHVEKHYENIAGVEIPFFENVLFADADYFLFDTPSWIDSALIQFRKLIHIKERLHVADEKKRALAKELREVSIRVNLFEKILIPRTNNNIKKIKIFLSDQELASVAQAKVAKMKLRKKRE